MEEAISRLIDSCNKVLIKDWKYYVSKFNNYIKDVNENKKIYYDMMSRLPIAITQCVPIGDAGKSIIKFNLRYNDKKIAEIVGVDDSKRLKLKLSFPKNLHYFGFTTQYDESKIYDWQSYEAKKFRSHFKSIESAEIKRDKNFNQEATIQTALWRKLKGNKSEVGSVKNIRPVCMYKRFFEPPAFVAASNIKDNQVIKSKNSGNVDMIARIAMGKNSELAIIEMKKAGNTKPIDVIRQAVVYAVCTKKLLFCRESDNHSYKWWNLFGYSKQTETSAPPSNFVIHAVACMPYKEGIEKGFINYSFDLGDGVTLKLDYMYFDFDKGNLNSIRFRKENVSIQKIQVVE